MIVRQSVASHNSRGRLPGKESQCRQARYPYQRKEFKSRNIPSASRIVLSPSRNWRASKARMAAVAGAALRIAMCMGPNSLKFDCIRKPSQAAKVSTRRHRASICVLVLKLLPPGGLTELDSQKPLATSAESRNSLSEYPTKHNFIGSDVTRMHNSAAGGFAPFKLNRL